MEKHVVWIYFFYCGEKFERCLWCALEAVSLRQIPVCGNWKCSSGTVMPCADKSLHSARLLGSALCQQLPRSHKHTKPQKETQQIFPMVLQVDMTCQYSFESPEDGRSR
ncbi:uncharacterized protein [Aphelocoma coerulescens]|uniref:uncharacterized protein isoform X2 n=1 Tax=Aphelocoma coerulescens TaxID=39617 RepID=UPI003604FE25